VLTISHWDLNGYSPSLCMTFFLLAIEILAHDLQKKLIFWEPNKIIWWLKWHLLGNKRDISACIRENSNNFCSYIDKIVLWSMQNFQFLLLTYWLEFPVFLKEVTPDVVRAVPLCGSLQNMFFYHTVQLHTYGTWQKLFVSQPRPYTCDTLAVSQTG
jgi:hypothetical protein